MVIVILSIYLSIYLSFFLFYLSIYIYIDGHSPTVKPPNFGNLFERSIPQMSTVPFFLSGNVLSRISRPQVSWSGRSTSRWPTRAASQGRANKLVDSCYSFWQGAIFPLLHEAFRQSGADMKLPEEHCWFLDPCFRRFQGNDESLGNSPNEHWSWNYIQLTPRESLFQVRTRALADVHLVGVSASKWGLAG